MKDREKLMRKPKFSIIVPVYKVEDYLQACVDSLLAQEAYEDQMEILLIDDGSPDRSGELCDRLSEAHGQIKAYHKPNGGLSSARNYGLDRATGEYVLFVDSDDVIESDTLKKIAEALDQFGEVDAVFFDGVEDDSVHQDPMRRVPLEQVQCADNGKQYLLEHFRDRNLNVEACLYAYRRTFLNEHDLRFREGILHEDVEFTPRIMMQCGKVAELPDQLYHYLVRENSISTQKNKEKNIRDLFQTLREQNQMAEQQEPELKKWMKNAILDSYLNMVQTARMYQKQYRKLLDKRFLLGKAATNWNRFRVLVCLINVRLYCLMNDCYKKL